MQEDSLKNEHLSFYVCHLDHVDRFNPFAQVIKLVKYSNIFRRPSPFSNAFRGVPWGKGDELIPAFLVADHVYPSDTFEVVERPLCKVLPFFQKQVFQTGLYRPVSEVKYHSFLDHRHHTKQEG